MQIKQYIKTVKSKQRKGLGSRIEKKILTPKGYYGMEHYHLFTLVHKLLGYHNEYIDIIENGIIESEIPVCFVENFNKEEILELTSIDQYRKIKRDLKGGQS